MRIPDLSTVSTQDVWYEAKKMNYYYLVLLALNQKEKDL